MSPDAEEAALLTGVIGGAATAAALIPDSWKKKAKESLSSEATASAVAGLGAAALFGIALGGFLVDPYMPRIVSVRDRSTWNSRYSTVCPEFRALYDRFA